MTTSRTLVIVVLLAFTGLAVSIWAYPQLPEMVPSHWNISGEVDDTMRRSQVAFLMPGLILGLGLVLLYLPNIDPLRANVERFRSVYNGFIIGAMIFFLYLHFLIILAGLGVVFDITFLVITAASLMMVGIALVLERTKPNWFLGIRTPWTLSSSTVWEKTHRLGSRLFMLSGGAMLLGLFFSSQVAFIIMMASILFTTLATILYSYLAYRAE
jgi:uncharacterized membrane protein